MCEDCKEENPTCAFCKIGNKVQEVYFDKEGESLKPYQVWVDVEEKNGEIQWYAVLNGSQYTTGHTMIILGCHMDKITEFISDNDVKKRQEKLQLMMEGINRFSHRLKEKLGAQSVHVLGLCEGMPHLHFHLIPRYSYNLNEEQFFRENYAKRYIEANRFQKLNKDITNKEIHGMWYDAYQEMNYVFSRFNQKSKEERAKELEMLANGLRDDKNGKKQEIINREIAKNNKNN